MARIGRNQLAKLQKRYETDEAIAGLYGISRQAVHKLRKKYGIPIVRDRHRARNESITKLREEGITIAGIARRFGLTPTHIHRILRDRAGEQSGR